LPRHAHAPRDVRRDRGVAARARDPDFAEESKPFSERRPPLARGSNFFARRRLGVRVFDDGPRFLAAEAAQVLVARGDGVGGRCRDGRAGELLLVRMESEEFDTYLMWGRGQGSWEEVENNDDSGAGTNSRMVVRLDRAGLYEIRASAFAGDSASITL
jgi:hypothetical protein